MPERLRRAGIRSIDAVVDITNYVMLELGQPLHAYDAARVQGAIRPRLAKADELAGPDATAAPIDWPPPAAFLRSAGPKVRASAVRLA